MALANSDNPLTVTLDVNYNCLKSFFITASFGLQATPMQVASGRSRCKKAGVSRDEPCNTESYRRWQSEH